jgi:hypothetical protein
VKIALQKEVEADKTEFTAAVAVCHDVPSRNVTSIRRRVFYNTMYSVNQSSITAGNDNDACD